MRNLRIIKVMMIVCLMSVLSGCDYDGIKNPDDYIKSVYPDYEQLTKLDNPDELMILLKSSDSYELVRFKRNGNTFAYNGGHITNAPYALDVLKTEDKLYIIVFLDNTEVKADRFSIQLSASDKEEYITLNCPNLLKHNEYIIKAYEMGLEYDEVKPIEFYDKEGELIPEEAIPFLE